MDDGALERVAASSGAGPAASVVATILRIRGVGDPERAQRFLRPLLARDLPSLEGFDGIAGAAAAIERGRPLPIAVDLSLDAALAAAVLEEGLEAYGTAVLWSGRSRDARVLIEDDGISVVAPDGVRHGVDDRSLLSLSAQAWYLLAAIRRHRRERDGAQGPNLGRRLDLVALGTLAGERPVHGAARPLVHAGVARLTASPSAIFRAMSEEAAGNASLGGSVTTRVLIDGLGRVAARGQAALSEVLAIDSLEEARLEVARLALDRALTASAPSMAAAGGQTARPPDAAVSIADLTPRFAAGLALLEPYGPGHPPPLLEARRVRIESLRPIGDPARGRVRIRLRQDGRTLAGIAAAVDDSVGPGDLVDVRFVVQLTRWQGRERVGLSVHWLSRSDENRQDAENIAESFIS